MKSLIADVNYTDPRQTGPFTQLPSSPPGSTDQRKPQLQVDPEAIEESKVKSPSQPQNILNLGASSQIQRRPPSCPSLIRAVCMSDVTLPKPHKKVKSAMIG